LDLGAVGSRGGAMALFSVGDRRAIIKLGHGWTPDQRRRVQAMLQGVILPACDRGQFAAAIEAGVGELERLMNAPATELSAFPILNAGEAAAQR
jgi:uncharacterized membrane protein YgcG